MHQDPEQVQEWLRQNNLIYGGLIAIGVVAGFWHIYWLAGDTPPPHNGEGPSSGG